MNYTIKDIYTYFKHSFNTRIANKILPFTTYNKGSQSYCYMLNSMYVINSIIGDNKYLSNGNNYCYNVNNKYLCYNNGHKKITVQNNKNIDFINFDKNNFTKEITSTNILSIKFNYNSFESSNIIDVVRSCHYHNNNKPFTFDDILTISGAKQNPEYITIEYLDNDSDELCLLKLKFDHFKNKFIYIINELTLFPSEVYIDRNNTDINFTNITFFNIENKQTSNINYETLTL